MEIFFLRHGDASNESFDDESRELTTLGEQQANAAGRTLARLGCRPRVVAASPLLRARQTAKIAMKHIGADELIVTEYLTPTADPRQLVGQLNDWSQPSALLVGHMPNLLTAASLLVAGTRNAGFRVGTGTMIAVETPPVAEYGNGLLKWLLSFEEMRAMNRGGS